MKNFIFMAVAAIAVLSSCSSDNDFIDNGTSSTSKASVFTATIEGDALTRTTLSEGSTAGKKVVKWSNGDQISINGSLYTTTSTSNAAEFTLVAGQTEPELDGGMYKAIYPANLNNAGSLEFPSSYTYTDGKFDMPMYAEGTTTELSFKNICSVLAIKVTSDDIAQVKAVKVAADVALCGAFTINAAGDAAVITNTSANKEVVVNCSEAVTLDAAGTTFYVPIPAQTYKYFKIYLSADGSTFMEAMITKKAQGIGAIARNVLLNIDYERNAVRLYADGPLWATMNIGATTVAGGDNVAIPEGFPANASVKSCYGTYFKWGETAANTDYSKRPTYTGCDNPKLCATHDAATVNWGSAWRTPTEVEYHTMLDDLFSSKNYRKPKAANEYNAENPKGVYWVNANTTFAEDTYSVAGIVCVAANGLKVFFPAAGYRFGTNRYEQVGIDGHYWTSEITNPTKYANSAYYSRVYSFGIRMAPAAVGPTNNESPQYGKTVRAIAD